MASAANALRLCLRTTSQTQSLRAPASAVVASTSRSFSATPAQCGKNYIDRLRKRRKNKEHGQNEVEYEYEQNFNNPGEYFDYVARESQKEYPKVSKEEVKLAETLRGDWDALQQDQRYELGQRRKTISAQAADLRRPVKAKRDSFWNEEEQDSEYITEEIGEDDFEEDDIMAMGHGKLEEHREFREYARIAVWEMPLLARKFCSGTALKEFGFTDNVLVCALKTQKQNSQRSSSLPRRIRSFDSDTHRTWVNFIPPTERLWLSSALPTSRASPKSKGRSS